MSTTLKRILFHTALLAGGYDLKRYLTKAKRSQLLSHSALQALQLEKLNLVLRHIIQNGAGVGMPISQLALGSITWNDFRQLPATSKDDLVNIAQTMRYSHSLRAPISKHTSGSSGRPLTIRKQRSGVAQEIAATWRSYGWHGIKPGDRYVRIWGRPFSRRKRMLNRIRDLALNRTHVSAFDVTEAALAQRVAQIGHIEPTFIYGYASALTAIADFIISNNKSLPRPLSAVISTAEPLDERSRLLIERAFAAPCLDEYGCSEVGVIGFDCPARRMHAMADNLILEVQNAEGTITDEGIGELLITDLTNTLTPIIRYRTGDYCELSPPELCECQLPFPVIRDIRGRVEDVIQMPDGSSHHPALICYLVDEADKPFGAIKQYQVRQLQPTSFEIRIVPACDFEVESFMARAQDLFSKALKQTVSVTIKRVAEIPRERSGKFRIIVSDIQKHVH